MRTAPMLAAVNAASGVMHFVEPEHFEPDPWLASLETPQLDSPDRSGGAGDRGLGRIFGIETHEGFA